MRKFVSFSIALFLVKGDDPIQSLTELDSGNLPPSTIRLPDTYDLNKSSPHTIFGPYTTLTSDPRDSLGLMHFSDPQVLAINEFRSVKKYLKKSEIYKKRLEKIKSMDEKRKKKREMPVALWRKNMDKHLTVHIVAHTHDDVGWEKTYEEYYTGMEGKKMHARVEQILTEVVIELERDTTRKFTYVEMKFLNMWYVR